MGLNDYLALAGRQWRMVKRAPFAAAILFGLGFAVGLAASYLWLDERLSAMGARVELAEEQKRRAAEQSASGALAVAVRFSRPGNAMFQLRNASEKTIAFDVEDFWVVVNELMHHGKLGSLATGRLPPGAVYDVYFDPPVPLASNDPYVLAANIIVLYGLEKRALTQILRTQSLCRIEKGVATCRVALNEDDTIVPSDPNGTR